MEHKAEQLFIQEGHEGKTSTAYKNGFIDGFKRSEELQKEKEDARADTSKD